MPHVSKDKVHFLRELAHLIHAYNTRNVGLAMIRNHHGYRPQQLLMQQQSLEQHDVQQCHQDLVQRLHASPENLYLGTSLPART